MYLALVLMFVFLPNEGLTAGGTTKNIESIFLGRCHEFIQFKAPKGMRTKNCTALLDVFKSALYNDTKCGDDYSTIFNSFYEAVNQGPMPRDKALFWSGTLTVAHDLSEVNPNYITLEGTLPGFIANNLNFCGERTLGFNYAQCSCSWSDSQMNSFWSAASKQYAQNARGIVNVLLNGTRRDGRDAYRNTSIFATVELPNLNVKEVTMVKILIAKDLDRRQREKCGTKSIKKLRQDIEKRQIKVECIDDPRVVYDVLCANYGNSENCKKYIKHVEEKHKTWVVAGIILAVACGFLLIVIVVLGCFLRRRTYHTMEQRPIIS